MYQTNLRNGGSTLFNLSFYYARAHTHTHTCTLHISHHHLQQRPADIWGGTSCAFFSLWRRCHRRDYFTSSPPDTRPATPWQGFSNTTTKSRAAAVSQPDSLIRYKTRRQERQHWGQGCSQSREQGGWGGLRVGSSRLPLYLVLL